MRVLITSDLTHAGQNQAMLEQLAVEVQENTPDLFLIAGNIGEPLTAFKQNLAFFDRLTCPKALVTGNKDVWNRNGEVTSLQLWEEMLPEIMRKCNFTWLEQENLIIDRTGICGTSAWYDYSGRDTALGYAPEQYEELKGLVNKDAHYIDWALNDREFAAYLQDHFSQRLDELEQNRQVNHILVVTHNPVFQDTCITIQDDIEWRFGMAYTFNFAMGRVIAPKTKLRHVVSGHLHTGGQWEHTFGNNTFLINTVGRNNDGPRMIALDI